MRMVGTLLAEQDDEWQVVRRYMSTESLANARLELIDGEAEEVKGELVAARAGNFGAALARALIASGEAVVEVPSMLTARERRRVRRPGKSDPKDALAIARVPLPVLRVRGGHLGFHDA